MQRRQHNFKGRILKPQFYNTVAQAKSRRRVARGHKRTRITSRNEKLPFVPPEDWHEPTGRTDGYKVVVQQPGPGYRHILTPQDVRDRLGELPEWMTRELEVVQLSCMTRKKQSFPCYGMQWGASLYLYPIETSLVEYYTCPPTPAQENEARMYGGCWKETSPGVWALAWNEQTIRDFYLNNILIHELGHLVDTRNTGYAARERFAEWFALEYGYKRSSAARPAKKIVRRHHRQGSGRLKRA
ncbi:MAG: hypothetical protein DWQ37_02530 [Planctomycetota bacterium]|nr:MAG: hypothetical protein DWQ37_02530 [Planctomycetota bacterium]